jgi:hypothetical protein
VHKTQVHQGHHPASITNNISQNVESNTTEHARHEVSVVGVERQKTFAPGMIKKLELLTVHNEMGDEREEKGADRKRVKQ